MDEFYKKYLEENKNSGDSNSAKNFEEEHQKDKFGYIRLKKIMKGSDIYGKKTRK